MDGKALGPVRGVRLFFEGENIFKTYEMPCGKMVMNKQYKGIQNITPEDRELVLKYMEHWQQNRHRPDGDKVKTLFAKYHEYVYKSPSDISCPSCVQFIYDYWKGYLDG